MTYIFAEQKVCCELIRVRGRAQQASMDKGSGYSLLSMGNHKEPEPEQCN